MLITTLTIISYTKALCIIILNKSHDNTYGMCTVQSHLWPLFYSLPLSPSYPLPPSLSPSHLPSHPLASVPSSLYSFQVIFHAEQEKFTIDDGFQQPITLSSPSRELLGATFYKFVLKNIGTGLHAWHKYMYNYTTVVAVHILSL